MKISASIYSNTSDSLEDIIKSCEENAVELLHVDCNDDPAVFKDIARIRTCTNKPIDLHLITPHPSKYWDLLRQYHVAMVTFQYEDLQEPLEVPADIDSRLGLAITSETGIEVFEPYAEKFSFILFMATTPGRSGGAFEKSNFRKIRHFMQKYPAKKVHVDGGVNAEVSFIIRNMGVYAAVSGSFLFKGRQMGTAMLQLKAQDTESHFLVKDFMRTRAEVPVLLPYQRSFKEVLIAIEKYDLGFTALADENYRLQGIISNADVRRGLIKNMDNIARTTVEDMLNPEPVFINEDATVSEMVRMIKSRQFAINFLPVVNDQQQITGAVTFFNLIKGEL